MTDLIEGRVAQILSEGCIVINVGTTVGVVPGMIFVALAQGEEVKDPESGEGLGRWELPKGYLRVTHAQERLSTCEGFDPRLSEKRADTSTEVLSAAMISASMRPEMSRGAGGVPLNVNRSQMTGLPSVRPISIGDHVRQAIIEPQQNKGAPPGAETKAPTP